MSKSGGVEDEKELRAEFWRDTRGAAQALLPFLWTKWRAKGSSTATRPGHGPVRDQRAQLLLRLQRALSGRADPPIDSNDKKPNPNVTVLEWLNRKPAP